MTRAHPRPAHTALQLLTAAWLALSPCGARADAAKLLVLIDPDPQLARAVAVALTPWGLRVETRVELPPGAALPRSAERARALAASHDADALAWVSNSPDGYALWVYEAEEDRVVARAVPSGPPFDEPEAAALALTLKALLRHSAAAPEAQRFGAVAATQPAQEARAMLEWAVAGGLRAFTLRNGSVEPRVGISLAYMLPALGGHLGPVVAADLATIGVDADAAGVDASLRANALAVGAGARWPLGAHFDLGGQAALSARFSKLQGQLSAPSQPVSITRVNPTVAAHLSAGAQLEWVRLFLHLGIDVPLRTQRFLVSGTQVLELSPVALSACFGVSVPLLSPGHR